MAYFSFKCTACPFDGLIRLDADVQDRPQSAACPDCGCTCENNAVPNIPRTPKSDNFRKPIEMVSIGLHDAADIRSFQERCPGVQVIDDPRHPDYGVPIARNRAEKKRALAAVGFEEHN